MRKVGVGLLVAAAISLAITMVTGAGGRSVYDDATRWLIAMLAGGGLLMLDPAQRYNGMGASIGVVAATQLGGAGATAIRRWYTSQGFGNGAHENLELLQLLAAVLCCVGFIVGGVCAIIAYLEARRPQAQRNALSFRVAFAAAAVLAITLPFFMGHGRPAAMTLTAQGAHALMYGFPWAFALALSPWLKRTAALTMAMAVAFSAVPLVFEKLMIWAYHPTTGFGMACLGAAAVVITRWNDTSVSRDGTGVG